MADIFISDVEEDRDIALALSDGLEAAGFTTWCYERHSVPGPSYLAQTREAIEQSRVFLIVISRDSLGSFQIDKEVVRAHETGKPFVPVLRGVTHAEFNARQPEWGQAAGGATSIEVKDGGGGAIVPSIIRGLHMMRVVPAAAGPEQTSPPAIPTARSAPTAARTSARRVRQTRENELIFECSFESALEAVTSALRRLGKVTTPDVTGQFVAGRVRYGLQSVRIRVSLVADGPSETRAVVQASADDIWGTAARSATRRLVETLLNLDNPGYKPDRLGLHPAALAGLLLLFGLLVALLMKYGATLFGL